MNNSCHIYLYYTCGTSCFLPHHASATSCFLPLSLPVSSQQCDIHGLLIEVAVELLIDFNQLFYFQTLTIIIMTNNNHLDSLKF